jgi:4-amino-4-deoxy-L-arabinose transferase-like glycosyltransferase
VYEGLVSGRVQTFAVRHPALPLSLLALLCVISLAARAAWLGAPCRSPCHASTDHVLIFDEVYYVNAARVIAGIHPPQGSTYANDPLGDDPNSEHPQLVKLVIAGSIELFGDGPLAWRLGSLVFGTVAILGMFALARAAGLGRWPALAAAALMAADNLMIVQGRIGTLDIYALAAMVWAAVAYLRGRPLLAGVLIGVGACAKLVAGYLLLALLLLEAFRWLRARAQATSVGWRLARTAGAAVAVFVGLLALMDRIAPPYDDTTHRLLTGGVFGHISHMFSYAAHDTSPHGPKGIASYPWGWPFDYKPITYLYINPAQPTRGLYHVHPQVHFLALISPPILLLALPGLALAVRRVWRTRGGRDRAAAASGANVPIVALAWFLGTYLPFVVLSLFLQRTSYLYYMLIVMPGLYLAAVWLATALSAHRRLLVAWAVTVLLAAVIAYPLTPLP